MDFDSLPLENVKCSVCDNYLSYFPIYLTNDGKNICGRCPATSEKYHNIVFETVSKLAYFPCRYKKEGCHEEMVPKDISEHEPICPYKVLKCPGAQFTGCNWKGARPTIMEHCLDNHSELFLQDSKFVVDFSQTSQFDNFLKHDNILYIFSRRCDATSNVLQYSVHHVEDELDLKNYSGRLSLQNGKTTLVNEYSTTSYQEKGYESIVLDSLKVKRETEIITGRIIFGQYSEDAISVQKRINEELLSHLKCSFCFEYALPPIYHDDDNNIYCSKCNSGNRGFRSYNLEKMANSLFYPCENKERGCNMVLKPKEMREHQNLCDYKLHNCPLANHKQCSWKGVGKDLLHHIEMNHNESLIENYECLKCDLDLSFCFILKNLNHLFKIEFNTLEYDAEKNRRVYWRVQHIDYCKKIFWYQVQLDKSRAHCVYERIVGNQECDPHSIIAYASGKREFLDLIMSFDYVRDNWLDVGEKLKFRVSIL